MSRAEITSEINDLVKQGNVRDAYAKFEELPLLDQIGISISPGVGDALALYETGEFGKRAKERFSEGETLKGFGNLAIAGLSAASLIPLLRILRGGRGAIKTVAKTAADVAPVKIDPVLQLSGPKPKKVKVKPIPYDKFEPVDDLLAFDYRGTRPSEYWWPNPKARPNTLVRSVDGNFVDQENLGLVSGVRKVINEENLPDKLTLEQWTKKLLGFGNVKKAELQALDFVDELGNPHPKAVDYFSDLLGTTNRKPTAAINKKGIDNYLAERQTHLFDIRQTPNSQWPRGSKIGDGISHNQKVYRARGILSGEGVTGKETNAHFNSYYDNVAVFDHANNTTTDNIARNLERLAGKFDPMDILSDPRMNPNFSGNEASKLVKLSEKLNAEDIVPEQLENFKAGPDAELYSKFIKAHKKLGIPEKKEILDFAEELRTLGIGSASQFKQIRRAQSDYAEDIAKGLGYFDMSRFEGRKFIWPSLAEEGGLSRAEAASSKFIRDSKLSLNVKDTVARRNSLVRKLINFDEKPLKTSAKTPRINLDQRYKISKEIEEIDNALITEAKDSVGDVFIDPNILDTFEEIPDATKKVLKTLREDFLSRTPTQRRALMMRRYDRMEELKDLPFDAKNKLARDVTLLQYMRTALDPRYVKAKKLYPDLLRPSKVMPRAKSVDLPGLDAPYKKDFFENRGRPVVNPLVLRKNLLDAVAEGKKGIHIDYAQVVEEGGGRSDVVTAQYREMTKTLRKVLQELKVKDEVLEIAVPNTGSFDDKVGKYAFSGEDDIGSGAYYKFTPEFLDAVKRKGINAFTGGGPVDESKLEQTEKRLYEGEELDDILKDLYGTAIANEFGEFDYNAPLNKFKDSIESSFSNYQDSIEKDLSNQFDFKYQDDLMDIYKSNDPGANIENRAREFSTNSINSLLDNLNLPVDVSRDNYGTSFDKRFNVAPNTNITFDAYKSDDGDFTGDLNLRYSNRGRYGDIDFQSEINELGNTKDKFKYNQDIGPFSIEARKTSGRDATGSVSYNLPSMSVGNAQTIRARAILDNLLNAKGQLDYMYSNPNTGYFVNAGLGLNSQRSPEFNLEFGKNF